MPALFLLGGLGATCPGRRGLCTGFSHSPLLVSACVSPLQQDGGGWAGPADPLWGYQAEGLAQSGPPRCLALFCAAAPLPCFVIVCCLPGALGREGIFPPL